ncbi:hypothetical protein L6452_04758 [Arctium lappa]|uniref:Uncharacterized protein n=1 Tax=Arctium lappa TaxID=4217 RepID=A0ACB9EE40_ARCLA|nr:hypothetical protein L6452_04758 [Arctium lappa]
MKKNSFSNYMNTADNPLDEDGNEIKSMKYSQESKGSTSNNPAVVKQLIELNNQCSFEGNNAIGVKVESRQKPQLTVESDGINAKGLKVELRQTQMLPVALDGKGDMKKSLHSIKRSDESDDDFMSIPKPVTSSSTIILDSDKPIPRKITKRIVEGMKGITLNEVLKERIDATRGRLRNRDTKAKDKMKRSNESLLYVERTTLPNIPVERISPATMAWNVELLKKREIAEIENGGLGSATLLERKQEEANNKDEFTLLHGDSFEKGRDDLEHERDVRAF